MRCASIWVFIDSAMPVTTSMNDNGHIADRRAPRPGPCCDVCGEPIGVYEPLIAIERGRARRTSRASEPGIGTAAGEYRHRECHDERRGAPASRDVSAPAVIPQDGQGSARACASARESTLAG
jgi:hypothetical protein